AEIKLVRTPIIALATSPASELIYYGLWFEDRTMLGYNLLFSGRNSATYGPSERIQVYYYNKSDVENVNRAIFESKTKVFYLIKNIYWPDDFDRLFKAIENSPRFRLLDITFFKGLEIYKFKAAG
ncbi:MAG: hypothetical protein NTW09_02710, partial [Candidatus Omnitrophica bacterium]|nr:hypothetical protein [Candidatus Omnitrophota bacterium]